MTTAVVIIVSLRGISLAVKDQPDRLSLNVTAVKLLLVAFSGYIVCSVLMFFAWNDLKLSYVTFILFSLLYLIVYLGMQLILIYIFY